jgi:hypothetical protein
MLWSRCCFSAVLRLFRTVASAFELLRALFCGCDPMPENTYETCSIWRRCDNVRTRILDGILIEPISRVTGANGKILRFYNLSYWNQVSQNRTYCSICDKVIGIITMFINLVMYITLSRMFGKSKGCLGADIF